jgi:putative membrane protein
MSLLLRWLLNALALLLVANLVRGVVVESLYAALVVALVLGVLNAVVRPVLVFLTLPINVITLGLFTLVINAGLIWFVGTIVKGFTVTGFVPALYAALILWAVSWATNALLRE